MTCSKHCRTEGRQESSGRARKTGGQLLVIVGPTAVGKTAVAVELAQRFPLEVVSADSMQVYRDMDIGTAKPTIEERQICPHHLIDIIEPGDEFTVAEYQKMADAAIADITRRSKLPALVGGTGLYVHAVVDGFLFPDQEADEHIRQKLQRQAEDKGPESLHKWLKQVDPEAAFRIHPHNVRRVIRALEVFLRTGKPISYHQRQHRGQGRYDVLMFGLTMPRSQLYERINLRVDRMIERELLEEVESLYKARRLGKTAMQALGYKEMIAYLEGRIPWDEAVRILKRDTRRYAKRQLTWFRRDQRIQWVTFGEETDPQAVAEVIGDAVTHWWERFDEGDALR